FFLYREYQLERLAESFADNVYDRRQPGGTAPENLLSAHTVIVQTRGMGEYLRQVLAEKKQIAGNLQMPFVNSFINDMFRKIYGAEFRETEQRCDQKNVRKMLMRLFSSQEFIDQRVPELSKYISGVNAGLKRWQLAGKIADLFDQYQVYRFDRIDQLFSGNAAGSWQRMLYNELFNEQAPGRDHFFRRFLTEDFSEGYTARLPSEISVFGVGALPPVYLNIFVKLARYIRVNFFYLTPCLEFWEHQLSRRERSRLNAWKITVSGNPILQALGRQGRGFFTALLANEEVPLEALSSEDWAVCDDYPANSTMLEIMQYDILNLFDRRVLPENAAADDFIGRPRPDLKNDGSITLHSCHNIRRELEVLHDELLKLINSGIKPRDIIVMAPDISRCAPIIHAVFGSGPLQNVYSIADMLPDESVMVTETFKRILSVAAGRFEFSEVISLLDLPLISYSLGLQDGDLNKIAELLKECGVRWGYDAAMHGKFCQSEFEEFSWQMVFDRLLAGFAHRAKQGLFSSSSVNLIGNISSVDALESSKIELFARIVRFMENLANLSENVNGYTTVKQWKKIFEKLLADFFKLDNFTRTALAPLRSAIDELDSTGDYASGNYPLNAALEMLLDYCENNAAGSRFLRGRITFCRMVPMRSIPRDVVAVLDLNEKDFPRRGNESGFDLISLLPESGDRSATAQDRYLLLEALMSARKNLLLFYQGQSAVNNQECAASAPLNEIAEYLHNAFGLSAFKHKVSDTDPEYFKKDALFRSCSMESFLAAKQLLSPAINRPEKILPERCQG
ncbi:MAG: exodeoxyribonuclease V subunit gamma, partial [Lentisphaeria bacterium]|nr:exodeoxyribonuclease V subunit gamma [Lentisphaeria bacterium]